MQSALLVMGSGYSRDLTTQRLNSGILKVVIWWLRIQDMLDKYNVSFLFRVPCCATNRIKDQVWMDYPNTFSRLRWIIPSNYGMSQQQLVNGLYLDMLKEYGI